MSTAGQSGANSRVTAHEPVSLSDDGNVWVAIGVAFPVDGGPKAVLGKGATPDAAKRNALVKATEKLERLNRAKRATNKKKKSKKQGEG